MNKRCRLFRSTIRKYLIMRRALLPFIKKDLEKKMVTLSGPRQCGKTTLSKSVTPDFEYLNYDSTAHRKILSQQRWDRKKELIIFDEIHKMPKWKSWLKGIYDIEGIPPRLLVTGSSKLDTYKKMGDSMAGRYLQFRMHPLDLWELNQVEPSKNHQKRMMQLLERSGFPEPYLSDEKNFYARWKQTHNEIILRQDLIEHETPQTIRQMETLIELMKTKVGGLLLYNSLCEDLSASDKTIKRWVRVLEDHFIVFSISPIHKNIAKATKKAQKYYFYDVADTKDDIGAKIENLVACALLKQIQYRLDCLGEVFELNFFKNKDHKEIDFILSQNKKPIIAIEVKWADAEPSKNFQEIVKHFPDIKKIQLVANLDREFTTSDGVEVRRAANWLAEMPF
jgi:predicted AAA+ superfamily ATPase